MALGLTAVSACSLIPDFGTPIPGLPTSPPLPGLQMEKVVVTPVAAKKVTVSGLAGAAIDGTRTVVFWCDPTPEPRPYGVLHRGASIAEASASVADDGSFPAITLESQIPGESIQKGYILELLAIGAEGRYGKFYQKVLE